MLTEICGYLNNYFIDQSYIGVISISDGQISCDGKPISIEDGQYFTLVRTKYVLGVYLYGTDTLEDKTFEGAVWIMDIPDDVKAKAAEAQEWSDKYSKFLSSPFQSENKADYSYSLKQGLSESNVPPWVAQFGAELSMYRRTR